GTRLRFSYLYQYVHWFFLTWEGYGSLSTKSRIPTQNLHSATLTYSWQHQRYNLSLECNNIFDTMAFDNFKLQKPGRNILCKFRLFIQ
ncbi:MAG: TonB-dependent receptor, partial [Prevotella sp.]|nr:TonB-dependent receptor [Prevotella sp.]